MMPNAIYRVQAEMIVSKSLMKKLESTAPFFHNKEGLQNSIGDWEYMDEFGEELAHVASCPINGLGTARANLQRRIGTPSFSSTMGSSSTASSAPVRSNQLASVSRKRKAVENVDVGAYFVHS